MGRDIFSQLLAGARVAFMVGVSAAVMSVVLGTAIGMTAGYMGKFMDTILMRTADMIMVMPTLLFVLIISSVFGQLNIWTIVLIIALFRWPGVSRMIRGKPSLLNTAPLSRPPKWPGRAIFELSSGISCPMYCPCAFLFMTFRVTSAIIIEASLAFLGFGDPGTVSWGMMLQWVWKTGYMFKAPYWLLPPGICISLITLSFYMLGRAMDEVLDPRLRKEEQAD